MATYIAFTTANYPEVQSPDELRDILEDWEFVGLHGDLTVEVDDGYLRIIGEAEFQPYPKEADTGPGHAEPRESVDIEGFLEEIAPYLAEDLIVHTVGREKLRFPFYGAVFAVDHETGETHTETLQGIAHRFLDDDEEATDEA